MCPAFPTAVKCCNRVKIGLYYAGIFKLVGRTVNNEYSKVDLSTQTLCTDMNSNYAKPYWTVDR